MPKLILLDAGGVLTTNHLPALFQQMAEEIGSDPDELLEIYRTHLRTHLWSGGEDEEFFWHGLLPPEEHEKIDYWRTAIAKHLTLLPGALKALRDVAGTGPVWLLSNHLSRWLMPLLEDHGAHQHLEEIFISSDLGVIKPDEASYQTVLSAWMHPPETILFVDDQERNLEVARKLGMRTFLADPGDVGKWRSAALTFRA